MVWRTIIRGYADIILLPTLIRVGRTDDMTSHFKLDALLSVVLSKHPVHEIVSANLIVFLSDKYNLGEREMGKEENLSEKECYTKILDTMQRHKLLGDRSVEAARRLSIQRSQQGMYQNTKKLLKNFRDIRWAVMVHVLALASPRQRPALEDADMKHIASYLEYEKTALERLQYLERDDLRLLSEVKALRRSADLLALIEEYVGEIEGRDDAGKHYARILRYNYIDDGVPDYTDFLKTENISQATYYRYLNNAVSLLSDLLWGAPTGKLSALVDVAIVVAEIRPERKPQTTESNDAPEGAEKVS